MMVPYMFHDSLLDDWFNSDWDREFDRAVNAMAPRGDFGKRGARVMKTDVRETADGYDVFLELPGFKKEDVKLDLQNGYLTITASRNEDRDEKDDQGHYIRQERYTGSCARSTWTAALVAVLPATSNALTPIFIKRPAISKLLWRISASSRSP